MSRKYHRNKKSIKKAQDELDATYAFYGIKKKKRPKPKGAIETESNYTPRAPDLAPTSDKIEKMPGKVDYQMMVDRGEESEKTVSEINAKKKRCAPLYSKGGMQYITDRTDKTEIGKKI